MKKFVLKSGDVSYPSKMAIALHEIVSTSDCRQPPIIRPGTVWQIIVARRAGPLAYVQYIDNSLINRPIPCRFPVSPIVDVESQK